MTEQKHTRGPWKIGENDSEVISHDGALVAAVYADATSSRRANAHIIAASLDMLEALKEAQQWLSGIVDGNDILDADRECLERIDAAIAKAEGRANLAEGSDDPDDNPFDPESPEGRAVRDGRMTATGEVL